VGQGERTDGRTGTAGLRLDGMIPPTASNLRASRILDYCDKEKSRSLRFRDRGKVADPVRSGRLFANQSGVEDALIIVA
jgi:hypothetical protein